MNKVLVLLYCIAITSLSCKSLETKNLQQKKSAEINQFECNGIKYEHVKNEIIQNNFPVFLFFESDFIECVSDKISSGDSTYLEVFYDLAIMDINYILNQTELKFILAGHYYSKYFFLDYLLPLNTEKSKNLCFKYCALEICSFDGDFSSFIHLGSVYLALFIEYYEIDDTDEFIKEMDKIRSSANGINDLCTREKFIHNSIYSYLSEYFDQF